MNPEAQRIAIAKACGWTTHPDQRRWGWIRPDGRNWSGDLPDYLSDLNAMHEAEATLSPKQVADYVFELHMHTPGADLTVYDGCMSKASPYFFPVIHATAAQRAEAFLRTLNLWQS